MGNKEYKVGDDHRTNPLSLRPGGSEVKVYLNGEIRIYDKIKSPVKYISAIAKKIGIQDIHRIEVDGELYWSPGNGREI